MTYDWRREGVFLKLQTLTDYEPTDAELAALSPEHRGVVKGWRMRGEAMAAEAEPFVFTYQNYRGETAQRRVCPLAIRFGNTEWHPEPQWLLRAFDLDKQAEREFAMRDFASPLAGPAEAGGVSDAEVEAIAFARRIQKYAGCGDISSGERCAELGGQD